MADPITAVMGQWVSFSKDGNFYTLQVQVRDDGTLCVDLEEAKRQLERKKAAEEP